MIHLRTKTHAPVSRVPTDVLILIFIFSISKSFFMIIYFFPLILFFYSLKLHLLYFIWLSTHHLGRGRDSEHWGARSHACTQTYTQTCMHTCTYTHAYTHTYTYIHLHACTHVYACVCMCVCVYLCIYVCVCMCISMFIRVCMCVYVCISSAPASRRLWLVRYRRCGPSEMTRRTMCVGLSFVLTLVEFNWIRCYYLLNIVVLAWVPALGGGPHTRWLTSRSRRCRLEQHTRHHN